MTTNAWFQLTTDLRKHRDKYRELALQCFQELRYHDAIRYQQMAEGLHLALSLQNEIAREAREKAVGSATQHPRPHGAQLT